MVVLAAWTAQDVVAVTTGITALVGAVVGGVLTVIHVLHHPQAPLPPPTAVIVNPGVNAAPTQIPPPAA